MDGTGGVLAVVGARGNRGEAEETAKRRGALMEVVVGCCGRGEAGEAVWADYASSGAAAATADVGATGLLRWFIFFPEDSRWLERWGGSD